MTIGGELAPDPSKDLPPWLSFVLYWLKLDQTRLTSEDAVRGEVMPYFLSALGYGGTTLNEVLHGHPLPRLRISVGSKSKRIDYIPTYRLQRFWIIETKSPGVGLTKKAFEQAYYYAIHHTVRARYFLLADGVSFRLYDVTAEEFDKARVVVTREDAADTFGQLYEMIAASKIKATIRADVLSDVSRLLADEVDEGVAKHIVNAVKEVADAAVPQIRQNLFKLRRQVIEEQEQRLFELTRVIETRGLLANAALPNQVHRSLSAELGRRIADGAKDGLLPEMGHAYHNVATATERFNIGRALLFGAYESRNVEISRAAFSYARESLSYCAGEEQKRSALLLERALTRVMVKLMKIRLADQAEIMAELTRRGAATEDLLRQPPAAIISLVMVANGHIMRVWREWKQLDALSMDRLTRTLEDFEREHVDAKVPHVSDDAIHLDLRGPIFDFLVRATADYLTEIDSIDPEFLPADLKLYADRFRSDPRAKELQLPPLACADAIVPDGDVDEEVRQQLITVLEQCIERRDLELQQLVDLAQRFKDRGMEK